MNLTRPKKAALAIALAAFATTAMTTWADDPFKIENGVLTGYNGTISPGSVIEVPDGVGDIGEMVFKNQEANVAGLVLPNSVTNIQKWAFSSCSNITEVTFGSSLAYIGAYAFYHCESLPSIAIPDSVTKIGDSVFSRCFSLKTVEFGSGLASTGESTFSNCTKLESVTFGAGLTTITNNTFYFCTNLTSITFMGDAPAIGKNAFFRVPTNDCVVLVQEGTTGWGVDVGGDEKWNNFDIEYLVVDPDQAAADAVSSAIGSIGKVAYTDACKGLIDDAREAYDGLTDDQKALVTNYDTLTAAEEEYAHMKDLAEFEEVKAYMAEQAASLALPEDDEECSTLITNAVSAINALEYDNDKTCDENEDVIAAIVTQLEADLDALRMAGKTIEVKVNTGTSTIEVPAVFGEAYTDEVIAQIIEAAQTNATRHGSVVIGLTNYDGSEVTGSTIVSTNDELTVQWGSENPLVPATKGEGAVSAAKAQTYDCYILDADGKTCGTATVTVGKRNAGTGLASVKASVKLIGSDKTYMFRATEAKGGKATISQDGATKAIVLSNQTLGQMTVDVGSDGVRASWEGFEVNGIRNASGAEKAVYASWKGMKTIAIADANNAYCTFSAKIAKSGLVNVRGYLSDGTALNASARLLITDDGSEACAAVKGSKKAPVGFTLWLKHDDAGNVVVEGVESATGYEFAGEAIAGSAGIDDSSLTLSVGEATAAVSWNGKTLKAARDSGFKVRYVKNSGSFSGSCKVKVADASGRTVKKTVAFQGVFVDGVGYGTTTTKGYAGVSVKIAGEAKE